MEQLYWKHQPKVTNDDRVEAIERLKNQLELSRSRVREQLKGAEIRSHDIGVEDNNPVKQAFIDLVKEASVNCTSEMLALAKSTIDFSLQLVSQEPLCPFQVVAIGSLARGEATPYSDLEYMFLVGEKSEQIVDYFEKFAITTYFVMGNLRETKLSYMAIEELRGWFEDKSQNGFKIDGLAPGAGNIPTGNGTAASKNHFIVTPEEMAQRYESVLNNPDEKEALRGDLTAMMAYMKPVFTYGNGEHLLPQLKQLLSEIKPNEKRQKVNLAMLKNDMVKFSFKPDPTLVYKGYTVDVKKELYRFPSLLLYDVSIVFGQIGDSVWETVELLYDSGILSNSVRFSVLFQLACACYMRLSAYLFYDSHEDRISVVLNSNEEHSLAESSDQLKRWVVPGGMLLEMCRYMVPLKQVLGDVVKVKSYDKNDILRTLQSQNLSSGWLIDSQIWYFSGHMKSAYKCVEEHFGEDMFENIEELVAGLAAEDMHHSNNIMLIADILTSVGKHTAASKLYSYAGHTGDYNAVSFGNLELSKFCTADDEGAFVESLVESVSGLTVNNLEQKILEDIGDVSWLKEELNKALAGDESAKLQALGTAGRFLGETIAKALGETHPQMLETAKFGVDSFAQGIKFCGNTKDGKWSDAIEGMMMPTIGAYVIPSVRKQYMESADIIAGMGFAEFGGDEAKEHTRMLLEMSPLERLQYIKDVNSKREDRDDALACAVYQLAVLHTTQGKYDIADAYYKYSESIINDLFGDSALVMQRGVLYREMGRNAFKMGQKESAKTYINKAMEIFTALHSGGGSVEIQGLEGLLAELEKDPQTVQQPIHEDVD